MWDVECGPQGVEQCVYLLGFESGPLQCLIFPTFTLKTNLVHAEAGVGCNYLGTDPIALGFKVGWSPGEDALRRRH